MVVKLSHLVACSRHTNRFKMVKFRDFDRPAKQLYILSIRKNIKNWLDQIQESPQIYLQTNFQLSKSLKKIARSKLVFGRSCHPFLKFSLWLILVQFWQLMIPFTFISWKTLIRSSLYPFHCSHKKNQCTEAETVSHSRLSSGRVSN